MGYELYRMIRDGAPESWTAPMRLIAMAIGDDARDPRQRDPDDLDGGGLPWSMITIRGERRKGRWHDGLTQRTGMSPDAHLPRPDRARPRGLRDARAGCYG